MLDQFIGSLQENLLNEHTPKEIDVIIDSGAFNGSFAYGALLYLKQLEKNGKIKVRRLSGASVGAGLSALYILDKLHLGIKLSEQTMMCFKDNHNFKDIENMLRKEIGEDISKNYDQFNDTLYLTYWDTNTKSQIIQHTYNSGNDVIEALSKTSFLPYLMNGNAAYQDCYIDGGFPYIFPERSKHSRKILFLQLVTYKRLWSVISIKNEVNIYERMYKGILEMHTFLTSQNTTDMCSYVNDWTIKDFAKYRMREFAWISIVYILDMLKYIKTFIPDKIKRSMVYNVSAEMIHKCYTDIMVNCCF